MAESIISVIGNTPLVALNKLFKGRPNRIFGKFEASNPGGSIKDRTALSIIQQGLRTGRLRANSLVIASSSGNMGIGLAQVCAYFDLRLICVVDPKVTTQNIRLLRAYGAEVDMVLEPDEASGEYLKPRLARVQALLRTNKDSFWPNQYSNLYAAKAHYATMREIVVALNKQVDYLFCAVSTCGTLRGCAEYIRSHKLKTTVIAIDAVGSIIFGGVQAKRLLPGHGASVIPKLYKPGLADEVMMMSDLECVIGCRRLVRNEGILAGGSAGAVLMALYRMKSEIPLDANCVLIFPDRGERYLDTIYSDEWVKEHFGDVAHNWEKIVEVVDDSAQVAKYQKSKAAVRAAKMMDAAAIKASEIVDAAANKAAKVLDAAAIQATEVANVAATQATEVANVAAIKAAEVMGAASKIAAKVVEVAASRATEVVTEAAKVAKATERSEVPEAAPETQEADEEECMTLTH
jgi:2,3-diaminopropionate biosynthesis protein SbnA